jgi:aldehyde dehydrogenase (NAD+)
MPTVKHILDTMEYGPSPEANGHTTEWLEQHKLGFNHFIAGAFVPSSDKGTIRCDQPSQRFVAGSRCARFTG